MKDRKAPTTQSTRLVLPVPSSSMSSSIQTHSSAPPSATRNARSLSVLTPPLEEGEEYGTVGRHNNVSLMIS